METWGTAESCWRGHGKGFGGIRGGLGESGAVWGNLGRMRIPSPDPPEDEVAGASGHKARPRSIPGSPWEAEPSRGDPAPRPQGRHICRGSQVGDYSLQLPGICISAGRAAAPSGEQGHFKDKTKYSFSLAGARGQGAPRRSPGTPRPRAAEPPAQRCTQRAAVLETQRAKP